MSITELSSLVKSWKILTVQQSVENESGTSQKCHVWGSQNPQTVRLRYGAVYGQATS